VGISDDDADPINQLFNIQRDKLIGTGSASCVYPVLLKDATEERFEKATSLGLDIFEPLDPAIDHCVKISAYHEDSDKFRQEYLILK
jgi:hypothetical protein